MRPAMRIHNQSQHPSLSRQHTISAGVRTEGRMQGGKPHGIGTVVVTKAHSIDLKNGTSRQVSKGDRLVDAKFKNGKLTQCYIHYANGEVETITIGY